MSSLPSAAAEELYVFPLLHQNENMTTLLCTTKHCSSSTLYYKVLLHTAKYYSSSAPVLQSTTPVRLCKHSTSPYYKVLLGTRKTYSVLRPILQSTTPVLLCTTKYYSTPYYKALLQYYSVSAKLPNAAPATKIDPPTSPNNARATRSDTPTWPNIAACQEKWHCNSSCGHKRPKLAVTSDPPPLPTPGGRKSASHRNNYLSEAVECRGAFRRHGGRWHWGRGRRRRRRRTFHRPRRSRPMCGLLGLWAPFRSGTADSSDWPGERVARIWSWCAFYKYLCK